MTKFLNAIMILVIFSGYLYAQTYLVQSIKGDTKYEIVYGSWDNLKVGMILAEDTKVKTGLNSEIIVSYGEGSKSVATVGSMKQGTLEVLISGLSNKSKIKIGAGATKTDITADEGQKRINISTASTRASNATKDLDWDE
jgi:hypothetical protein